MNKELLHSVLFWLDPALPAEEVENFKGFFEELEKIPTVKKLQFGRAASTGERAVVDNSFTYSMVATFASLEDHDSYQEDDLHHRAIEKYSKYWTKVVVHDMLVI
ncbi:stress responsive alpha/beta barrel protein [Anseongella ginsenosidimutans]|uniref:Stress responsive alpha/beta barrel protein n=1 Tax=Anseongella ginsenosidimutans TaxID=496056 RepID=A0A4R3KWB4_9SPHI|nr:Dabb family protein [Anseongella ginsenosidimutans]QEC51265.1 Dabb family protein [Anseongella ginsenosidimutans]TCS90049.1 stress responsive alpha/beta barrel protein [Anseongella ginsenosidimutans]